MPVTALDSIENFIDNPKKWESRVVDEFKHFVLQFNRVKCEITNIACYHQGLKLNPNE